MKVAFTMDPRAYRLADAAAAAGNMTLDVFIRRALRAALACVDGAVAMDNKVMARQAVARLGKVWRGKPRQGIL